MTRHRDLGIHRTARLLITTLQPEGPAFKRISPALRALVDLNVPGMHGFDLLTEIRSDPTTWAIPVLILTSSDDQDDVRKAYELNANSYLVKPRGVMEFMDMMNDVEEYWFGLARIPSV